MYPSHSKITTSLEFFQTLSHMCRGPTHCYQNSLVVSNLCPNGWKCYMPISGSIYLSVSVGLEELLLDYSSVQPRSQATLPSFPGHSTLVPRPLQLHSQTTLPLRLIWYWSFQVACPRTIQKIGACAEPWPMETTFVLEVEVIYLVFVRVIVPVFTGRTTTFCKQQDTHSAMSHQSACAKIWTWILDKQPENLRLHRPYTHIIYIHILPFAEMQEAIQLFSKYVNIV